MTRRVKHNCRVMATWFGGTALERTLPLTDYITRRRASAIRGTLTSANDPKNMLRFWVEVMDNSKKETTQ